MMFAVPTVFFRPDALAGHHVNHPAGNVGTDIAILWKNKSTGGQKATTVLSPDSWHNIYSLHFGTNLLLGTILMAPGAYAFDMEHVRQFLLLQKENPLVEHFSFTWLICWEIETKWGFHGTSGNTGMETSKQ